MTKTNFVEIATQMIEEIHGMNEECVENFNMAYAETFPATITRRIEIDGEVYGLKIDLNIKKF